MDSTARLRTAQTRYLRYATSHDPARKPAATVNSPLPSGPFRLIRPHDTPPARPASRDDRDALLTEAPRARRAIRAWPDYEPTRLVALPGVAEAVGVASLWYKDEGRRFGVGSFKPLGGGFAVSGIVARRIKEVTGLADIDQDELMNGKWCDITSEITVTCATDGNHGRAVAWAAGRFGCEAVIYLASIVSPSRERAIASYGARTVRCAGTHEDAARESRNEARRLGWQVVSETENASEPQIALDTLAGYTTLFDEIAVQLPDGRPPTHLFVQAGVGGLAGAGAYYCATRWGVVAPRLVVVEAANAACICRSLERGEPTVVDGPLDTIMAGLAAGEISAYAWKLLRHRTHAGMAIGDGAAEAAMRLLAYAPYGDSPIVAGESGVAGLAAALLAAQDPTARAALGIDSNSSILTVGTEGATDSAIYEQIVGRSASEVARGTT